MIVPGGEPAKADRAVVQAVWDLTFRAKLCRQSFVVAHRRRRGPGRGRLRRGHGPPGRAPGAVALHGVGPKRCRVGLKNGINAFGRKNYLGSFAPPFAVVNDLDFLDSLPDRDIRSGLAEAVKVALVRDRNFF